VVCYFFHPDRALTPNGKLILVDCVVPETDEPHFSKFIDLNMLVMTGGKERTEKEFAQLLAAAGFKLLRVIPTDQSSASSKPNRCDESIVGAALRGRPCVATSCFHGGGWPQRATPTVTPNNQFFFRFLYLAPKYTPVLEWTLPTQHLN
jgi:hypothetical protein